MKTLFVKKEEIKKNWLIIDAENAVLGRLAAISANILRGKNKVDYTPNQDCGDYLIIINSDKISMRGKKFKEKIYYKHTGHPGGLKESTAREKFEKNQSTQVVKLAIKRMMPRGPLASKQLSNCKIYSKSNHPHDSQNPKLLELNKINLKNIRE